MKDLHPPAIIRAFPNTRYHPAYHLVTWHPRGVFDDRLADRVVKFLELCEQIEGASFHRFTDMTAISRINLGIDHVFHIARLRRGYRGRPVKSAVYAVRLLSIAIARMYQDLMHGGLIQIEVFRDRTTAAEWLGVPANILAPPRRRQPA